MLHCLTLCPVVLFNTLESDTWFQTEFTAHTPPACSVTPIQIITTRAVASTQYVTVRWCWIIGSKQEKHESLCSSNVFSFIFYFFRWTASILYSLCLCPFINDKSIKYIFQISSSLQVRGRRPSQLPLDRPQNSQEPLHQPGSARKSHRRKGKSPDRWMCEHVLFFCSFLSAVWSSELLSDRNPLYSPHLLTSSFHHLLRFALSSFSSSHAHHISSYLFFWFLLFVTFCHLSSFLLTLPLISFS